MALIHDETKKERESVYSAFVRRFSFMTLCGDLIKAARHGVFSDDENRRFRTYLESNGKGGAIMAGLMTARQAPEGTPLHEWGIESVKSGLGAYYREDGPFGLDAPDVADFVMYSTKKFPRLKEAFAKEIAVWSETHALIAEVSHAEMTPDSPAP